MHRLLTMKRLSVLFLCTFAVAVGLAFAWQGLVKAPEEGGEGGGKGGDPGGRIWAQPNSTPEITGRPNGVSRAEASDAKNRELIAIEDQLQARKAARDAETARQRAALAGQR